ncbi:MAG: creatininase family protein [Brevefilum sp.]|nr:creatininase family protein [Brevefilum sp.]MDW7754593.1 creatininase family protein [Brevefilum sp.]
MHFADQNWMQIESYLEKDDRVMLVLGACEQHGYLSLLTDTKIPLALADAASDKTGVMIAPPLNFGCSPYFLDYPGTVSLRLHTYLDLVEDILRSLYGAGFRRILILNGHGGNTPVRTHLVQLVNELTDLHLRWYAWWTTETVKKIAGKFHLDTQHANWMEAFDFTQVTAMPKSIKPIPNAGEDIMGKTATRKTYGDGSFGGAYQANPSIMQEMFDACLEDILHLLNFDMAYD